MDEPCGQGVFTEAGGATVAGTWSCGDLSGEVVEQHAGGWLRYYGEYAAGKRNGFGVELRSDGGCLVGSWVDNALHGKHGIRVSCTPLS